MDGLEIDRISKGVIAAVVGGTASVLGGGKFENGAVTAAFGYMFNTFTEEMAARRQVNSVCDGGPWQGCSDANAQLKKESRWQALQSSVGPDEIALAGVGLVAGSIRLAVSHVSVVAERQIAGYFGRDGDGVIRYVGISLDPSTRFLAHRAAENTGRELLFYEVAAGASFETRLGARIWEQSMINRYGLDKFGGQLINRRNEIAPKYWSGYGL